MIEHWIWLTQIPYIGPVTANRLLQTFGSPERIYSASRQEISNLCSISDKQLEMIIANRSFDKAYEIIDQCNANDIHILTMNDNLYPSKAKTDDAPIVLYYKGKLKQFDNTVGIVGARRCTREARAAAIENAKEYSMRNVVVISGIISAWSDEVVVIGAGRGSGALITAEYAEKYGKEVVMIEH